MTQHKPVLTDEEMHALICGNPFTLGLSIARLKDFIRQVEKAVVAKLVAEQEPSAFYIHDNKATDAYYTDHAPEAQEWATKGVGVTALYAHPMPCLSPTQDKNDRQLARKQPCGCVICYCENQERCLGCGAKYCGTHEIDETPNPVYVDHIPDIGKMITPLAQRKIQTLLDNGEYRVIENATVLVNENGHAAIVNHGGAFYWVDNEGLAREFDAAGVRVDSDHIADMRKKVPEGWQLIPKEPTEQMRVKGGSTAIQTGGTWGCVAIEVYKAMLAAAPKYTGDSDD